MHLPSERPTRSGRASCRTIVGEFARESRWWAPSMRPCRSRTSAPRAPLR